MDYRTGVLVRRVTPLKTAYTSYSSLNSTRESAVAIRAARDAAITLVPDVTLFLVFALVWAAVFFIALSGTV